MAANRQSFVQRDDMAEEASCSEATSKETENLTDALKAWTEICAVSRELGTSIISARIKKAKSKGVSLGCAVKRTASGVTREDAEKIRRTTNLFVNMQKAQKLFENEIASVIEEYGCGDGDARKGCKESLSVGVEKSAPQEISKPTCESEEDTRTTSGKKRKLNLGYAHGDARGTSGKNSVNCGAVSPGAEKGIDIARKRAPGDDSLKEIAFTFVTAYQRLSASGTKKTPATEKISAYPDQPTRASRRERNTSPLPDEMVATKLSELKVSLSPQQQRQLVLETAVVRNGLRASSGSKLNNRAARGA